LKRTEVQEFVKFYLQNAEKLVPEVKYVALPKKAYDIGLEHLQKKKVGTVFAGHSDIGVRIEDLMKKESKE